MEEEKKLEERIENGLMPELQEDIFVEIGDKKIFIRELPIFYTKQINRKIGPLYKILSGGKVDPKDLISIDKIENFYNILAEVSHTIISFHSNNKDITKNFLEQNCSEKKLIGIIHKQLQANGLLDFLEKVLRGVTTVMSTLGTAPPQGTKKNL